jgi:hypothetical protein
MAAQVSQKILGYFLKFDAVGINKFVFLYAIRHVRRDKRDLGIQHATRGQDSKEMAQKEARLLRRVLAELHEAETQSVAAADAEAEGWARQAQRELMDEGVLSPDQVSEQVLVEQQPGDTAATPNPETTAAAALGAEHGESAEDVEARRQVARGPVLHDESNVNTEMRDAFKSIMRAQYMYGGVTTGGAEYHHNKQKQ